MTMSACRSSSSLARKVAPRACSTFAIRAHQVGIQQLDLEAAQAPGDRLSDAAEAADAHLGVMQIVAEQLLEVRALPLARAHHALAFGDPAHGGERQADRHVGDAVGQHPGRIGRDHAVAGAGVQVDVVEAYAHAAHRLEARAARQQIVVDAVGRGDERPIHPLQPRDHLVPAVVDVGLVRGDVEMLGQVIDRFLEHLAGDEHFLLHRSAVCMALMGPRVRRQEQRAYVSTTWARYCSAPRRLRRAPPAASKRAAGLPARRKLSRIL